MRVLIIDDDATYLSACGMVLAQDGHEVIACSNFEEARRQLVQSRSNDHSSDGSQHHFDALITDVRLGAYNGLHLITLAAPSTLKIAASAFFDPVLRRDAEQLGAQFVIKPTDCASVSALIATNRV